MGGAGAGDAGAGGAGGAGGACAGGAGGASMPASVAYVDGGSTRLIFCGGGGGPSYEQ